MPQLDRDALAQLISMPRGGAIPPQPPYRPPPGPPGWWQGPPAGDWQPDPLSAGRPSPGMGMPMLPGGLPPLPDAMGPLPGGPPRSLPNPGGPPPGMFMAPPPPPDNRMGPLSGMPSPGFNAAQMPNPNLIDPRPNEFPWAGGNFRSEPPTGIPTPEMPLDQPNPYSYNHPNQGILSQPPKPPPDPAKVDQWHRQHKLEREMLKPRQYGLGQEI